MIKLKSLLILVLCNVNLLDARMIPANGANYSTKLFALIAGDTLALAAGSYTGNLALNNLKGTYLDPIVIMGQANWTTIFQAQSCCNTVSITQCAYLVIRDLQLDGLNVPVDAIKGEGTTGNWAHHITLENLSIVNYGNNQQIVGISTKCPAWNWVIRYNKIIDAGTGMYLGNSDGSKPFVNGIIENNFISNTLGYNIEIKHQLDTVRDDVVGTMVNGKTIIRHNVFSKELNGSPGASARPNLLVGGFPLNGWGKNDYYEIYGNFFWQNPNEALFQGTGNIIFYNNILVNHSDPSGMRAVYFTAQNGVQPQNIKVFHNTIYAANSSGGIRIYNPSGFYKQKCYGNAVFAAQGITNFRDSGNNILETFANAGNYFNSPNAVILNLNLYPKIGKLTGNICVDTAYNKFADFNKDFNGDLFNWIYRGAYSGAGTNSGWKLQLDRMPLKPNANVSVKNAEIGNIFSAYPNPFDHFLQISVPFSKRVSVLDFHGKLVHEVLLEKGVNNINLGFLRPGYYVIQYNAQFQTIFKR